MTDQYHIVVSHNDALRGAHGHTLLSARTLAKLKRDYARYMARPASMRSFDDRHRVQVYRVADGAYFDINAI